MLATDRLVSVSVRSEMQAKENGAYNNDEKIKHGVERLRARRLIHDVSIALTRTPGLPNAA